MLNKCLLSAFIIAETVLGPAGVGLYHLCGHSSHSGYVWHLKGHHGPLWPGADFLEWGGGHKGLEGSG